MRGEEDERKCLLSSSWKARVEVRLTMLKKAKFERYPFIQSIIEEDLITK